MNEVYDRIESLCKSRNMNITEMCKICGIPRASMTDFKSLIIGGDESA